MPARCFISRAYSNIGSGVETDAVMHVVHLSHLPLENAQTGAHAASLCRVCVCVCVCVYFIVFASVLPWSCAREHTHTNTFAHTQVLMREMKTGISDAEILQVFTAFPPPQFPLLSNRVLA